MKFFSCASACFSSQSAAIKDTSKPGVQYSENFRIFTFHELRIATDNFSYNNQIGEGGFGVVYKGRFQGSSLAVKVLSVEIESMHGEREFISEIAALANIRHENLVRLKGCCVDGAKRYLVYDYMINNSLAHTLLGKEQHRMNFSWEARRNISIGVARGIAHLHEEVEPRIVHRDIKASNILLDENFIPKVADFGLSRLLRDDSSHVTTRVAGTLGYLAPEYAVSGRVTRKSDIYGFGVLLLEIISGRSAVDFDLELGEYFLVQKAWEAYEANNLLRIIDPTLNMNFPEEEAHRFLRVSLLCVQETAKLRPRMSVLVRMLTKETDMDNAKISPPGLLPDLMNIRTRQTSLSQTTSSTASTQRSTTWGYFS